MLATTRLIDHVLGDATGPRSAAVALFDGDTSLTYGELAGRVRDRAAELDVAERSVVVLTGARSVEHVVTYLALLEHGHVPLLAGAHAEALADAWGAAAVVTAEQEHVRVDRRSVRDAALHPELALLLSTSGSTGSPKLVRLSHDNLVSNAAAIAQYLELGPDDRGISALPLHYCYGLSVLHSHLLVGAAVVLTDASVVDPCFQRALQRHSVTNVAGVPHTFELLERAGPERLHVPSLRYVSQAGGRLAPDAVRRWIARTEGWGVDFYVMYGQTEATARMAYLRPEVGSRRPEAIGRPIPGGSFELRSYEGAPDGVGELVYRGPNVMLGYATEPADLSTGRSIDELRTGDLARYHADDDVYEIVGRTSRFVKPMGLRVDLDAIETFLRHELPECSEIAVGGSDEAIVIVAPGASAAVSTTVARHVGLPGAMVSVDAASSVPRTTNGKIDYDAVSRLAPAASDRSVDVRPRAPSASAVMASVLEVRSVPPHATFVSLGGDSLSYVECSIRLERVLGRLPADWHLRAVADLDQLAAAPRRLARVDTTVVLRAVSICAIVATHMHLRFVPGGAHILLAVVGFNLARFMMPIESTSDRVRAGLRTVSRVALPTVAWVLAGTALGTTYGLGAAFLVNNYVGPASHRGDHWHFWFIEVFVHIVVAVTLLLAVPAARRLERRFMYGFPLALLAVSLIFRMEWAWFGDWYNLRYRTHGVVWFFLLGWLVQRSTSVWQRVLTSALCIALVPGFFHYAPREWFIVVALVVLVWCREIPLPHRAVRPVATVASASMWILITHFTVWPLFTDLLRVEAAYVATMATGVLVWFVAEWLTSAATSVSRSGPPVRLRHVWSTT